MNLRDNVLEVLMAVAMLHYHDMLQLAPEGPYIERMKRTIKQFSITETELASWALTIHSDLVARRKSPAKAERAAALTVDDLVEKQTTLIQQQMEVIGNLSSQVAELKERMASLEGSAPSSNRASGDRSAADTSAVTQVATRTPRRRSHAKPLSVVWYEWLTTLPWKHKENRRRYHDTKVAVAFMHLFLPEGYDATGSDSVTKARILKAGQDAEEAILAFLRARNEKTKTFGTVVKTLKKIHTKGELNELILQYRTLCAGGRVVDMSPSSTVHILQLQHAQHPQGAV
ncbi:hypothetical protein PI124_g6886 [Phytophthora idaei]|nr:hypothetical protein PI124_g6886 [Phytophthora idaei]